MIASKHCEHCNRTETWVACCVCSERLGAHEEETPESVSATRRAAFIRGSITNLSSVSDPERIRKPEHVCRRCGDRLQAAASAAIESVLKA